MSKMSSDHSGDEDKSQVDEMNIVLLGRTGSGKSALANNILKTNVFQSFHSPVSVTCSNNVGETTRNEYKVKVVDTPGFKHTRMTPEEVQRCIVEAVDLSSPGPHAILYVCRFGRYSIEEHAVMKEFINILGEDVYKYTIFVLTYGNLLLQENAENYVDRLPQFFKKFIERCSGRQVVFNNLSYDGDNDQQNTELFSLIEMMRRKNNPPYFIRRGQAFIVNRAKNAAYWLASFITRRTVCSWLPLCVLLPVAITYFSFSRKE